MSKEQINKSRYVDALLLAEFPRRFKAAVDDWGNLTHTLSQMAGRKRKWSLRDLVEFEARLGERAESDSREGRRRYRAAIEGVDRWPKNEGARRRLGLRIWLEAVGSEGAGAGAGAGRRLTGALRIMGILLGVTAFLAGIGVLRGLLHSSEMFVRVYNVWLFLAVTLGVQWLLLLGGMAGYALMRRGSGALSLFQLPVSWLARRLAGKFEGSVWRALLEGGAGYRSALSWRIARLTQGAAIMFNIGLVVGFIGCLFFLSIRFYWESTFAGSGWGLVDFMHLMAAPWSWSGVAPSPEESEIGYSVLEKIYYENDGIAKMWPFLMMALLVYGLLPRISLWIWCLYKERRALASLEFQAPRHRELWRELTKTERKLASSGAGDGVVLIAVGGVEADAGRIRELLLRELRVNPRATYPAGVLDGERESEALEAMRKADLGVVLLVEGWALSPKQMKALHERVRAAGGSEAPVHYLVIGELREGVPTAPGREEWTQWKDFVDSLRDPAAEVVAFAEAGKGGTP